MKRVLRSSTIHKREKDLLDLNKVPCECKGFISDSDSSADYISAEGNVAGSRSVSHPSECEKDADSSVDMCLPTDSVAHDLGNGWRGGKGDKLDSPQRTDAYDAKVCEAKCASPLVLINSCPTKEGMCESQPSVCARDTAGVVNEDITSCSGACTNGGAAGKGRRGRKRKTVEIPSSEGAIEKDSMKEVVHLSSAQNGVKEKSSGSPESLKLVKTENASQSKVDGISEDAVMGDLGANVINAAGNTNNDRQEFRNGRRGRKRKIVDSVGDNKDNGVIDKKAEKLALDGKPQVFGRLLRSRTMATTDGEKQAYGKENVGFVGLQAKQEIDASGKKNIKMEMDGRARVSQKGGKVLKGRRGRPPKLQRENGNSKVIVNKKVKLGSQKNIKLPKAGNSVEDSMNGGSSELLDNQGGKTKEHKNKWNQLSAKGLKFADYGCQNRPTSERSDSEMNTIRRAKNKSKHKKDGDLGRREEQQLVRDEIISLIKKAGWTIEYRPRMCREYNDAVYVDWEGKTYWSVTLAYKSLKEKVENGTADVRAISVFTPISEDKLSILLRVRKEKKGKHQKKQKVGNKTGKQVTKVKVKRSAAECPGVSKCSENLNSRPSPRDVSSRKKTKRDSCEQGSSMVASCRGRPRSNRGAEIRKPCTLMARGSENGLDPDGDGFELYEGKRNLISWMIDLGTVPLGVKVKYMNQRRTSVMLEGKIDREGICCGCCNRILTLSDFESHAGSKLGQPFNNIYLESGPSLLQCLTDSWSKQEKTDDIGFHLVDVNSGDPNDDTCNICGDGGDLICCDGCPSTFHQSCLQIHKFPSGDWHCVYCSCKYCGMVGGRAYWNDTDDSELLACLFCEEKFHVSCIQGNDAPHINSNDRSFCGRGCQKLFERLEMLLGVRHELEEGFSWTIIHRQDVNEDTAHSSNSSKVECNSKLAVAFSIMDECFLPIIDLRSKTSMVQSVVYSCGSNFKRVNYSGFYTCVLERGDELVSAAAIRIHGTQLAEMPFIGTRYMYRRQGMCRRLLSAIETALLSLEIEKLVIPAISELNETWTKVFGFLPLEESKRQEMKYMSMIVFPGIDMLQKPLCKPQFTKGEITTAAGTELFQPPIEDVKGSSIHGPDSDVPEVKFQRHDDESAAAVGSGAGGPGGSLKDGPETTNGLVSSNLSSKDEKHHDFGTSHDKFENSKSSTYHSPELDMKHVPVGMTSASAQSGYITGFPETENSKCNFNLNQVSACGVESNSLMSSNKGTLELNIMEKMFCVPEDGKEALRRQCETNVEYLKHVCDYPIGNSVLKSDDFLSLVRGVKKNSILEESAAISSMASNTVTDGKGIAVHAFLPSQQEKENVIDISDAPDYDTSFRKDAMKVHEPGLVTSVDSKQVASSEIFALPTGQPVLQVSFGSNSLEPPAEVDASDNPRDKLFSLISPVEMSKALSNVNHETERNSLSGVSLPDDPHLSSNRVDDCSSVGYSGTILYNCESLCNLSSHPDVTCLSTPGNSNTCSVPEVDPGR